MVLWAFLSKIICIIFTILSFTLVNYQDCQDAVIGDEDGGPPSSGPVPVPPTTGTPPFTLNLQGHWQLFDRQPIVGRHEACFVMNNNIDDNRAYLIGGRETQDVDIFNPATGTWSKGMRAPQLLHHMQCVCINNKIYIAAAWTGNFPREQNVDVMWVYHTLTDTWSSKTALPEPRRRGAAAVVVDSTRFWVSHGNRGGHETGSFATSLGYIDFYDTVSETWILGSDAGFPDAPNPRDHTGGALVNGKICVAGGRNGGVVDWPAVARTDCFDPVTRTWSVEPNIPVTRSGSSYGTSCDGKMIVAGGERIISNRVDVFDGSTWQTFQNGLIDSRHGTGLAVDCVRNLIYLASGGSENGGGRVSTSLEIYAPPPPP
jgi:hypothetical protein